MTMFSQQTPGGYLFGECVSALQKRIRAADSREAAYWAVEIEACGARERKYLWNRLKVIVSEDIGPSSEGNSLVPLISALADNYNDAWERRNDSYRLFLMHAIIAMCQASKTRICDDLAVCVYQQSERYEIPDNALDKHTGRGRRMGRGVRHWLEEGIAVTPVNTELEPLASELKAEAQRYLVESRPWRYAHGRTGGGSGGNASQQPLV